ncbi:hypothetical protein [Haliangium ochraceum]|uniref:Lipoprotein n=1 Tax=Haliangium ochraceum (strain DSM 14365 / JCM 11303 / SMP-2) TaxID=502025 RepID=D0LVY1_HALO1|nr:hypothetical protein [Haliangium ochraceum]ACY14115.1 hypothetical protein Hoch_1564 [Haliangium ochraceum DSM 14365]
MPSTQKLDPQPCVRPRASRYLGPLALALLGLLSACTQIHRVSSVPEHAMGKRFDVTLRDGRSVHATAMVTPTGTVWVTEESPEVIPVSQVESFERPARHIGRRHGLMLGAVLGAATGVVIGYRYGDDPDPVGIVQPPFNAATKAKFVGVGVGLVGAAVGAVIGRQVGGAQRYILDTPTRLRLGAAPTQGGAKATLGWSF